AGRNDASELLVGRRASELSTAQSDTTHAIAVCSVATVATFGIQPCAVFDIDTRILLRVVLRRLVLCGDERGARQQRNGSPWDGVLQGQSPYRANGFTTRG